MEIGGSADLEGILCNAIRMFADILVWILLARAILSWFVQAGGDMVRNLYGFTLTMTEPFVAPIRQAMSRFNTGMIDFSVLIAFFAVRLASNLLIMLVQLIF